MTQSSSGCEEYKLREDLHLFWFGELHDPNDLGMDRMTMWFGQDAQADRIIREHYLADIERALRGEYDHWSGTAEGSLALILLLDQFPRNAFRGSAKMYAGDERALKLCREGIEHQFDAQLRPIERVFFYLPLEHAEELRAQQQCLAMFDRLIDDVPEELRENVRGFREYAVKHYEIVARFGRFPHRNVLLDRSSTPEEIEFLKQPGSSF